MDFIVNINIHRSQGVPGRVFLSTLIKGGGILHRRRGVISFHLTNTHIIPSLYEEGYKVSFSVFFFFWRNLSICQQRD
jgi:hypothetical protein